MILFGVITLYSMYSTTNVQSTSKPYLEYGYQSFFPGLAAYAVFKGLSC